MPKCIHVQIHIYINLAQGSMYCACIYTSYRVAVVKIYEEMRNCAPHLEKTNIDKSMEVKTVFFPCLTKENWISTFQRCSSIRLRVCARDDKHQRRKYLLCYWAHILDQSFVYMPCLHVITSQSVYSKWRTSSAVTRWTVQVCNTCEVYAKFNVYFVLELKSLVQLYM